MDGREGGFIVVHRRVRSSPLYRSLTAEQRTVFFTLLLLANWKDSGMVYAGKWVDIRRGEFAHSLETIATEAGTSVKVVRTTLKRLLAVMDVPGSDPAPFLQERFSGTGQGRGLRVLTIVKYDHYQSTDAEEGTEAGSAGARPGHGEGTAGALREPVEPREPRESLFGDDEPPHRRKPGPKPKSQKAPGDPRFTPLRDALVDVFKTERRSGYAFDQQADPSAIKRLLALADEAEILRRWRLALNTAGFHRCNTIAQLAEPRHWNEFAAAPPSNRNGMAPVGQDWDAKF